MYVTNMLRVYFSYGMQMTMSVMLIVEAVHTRVIILKADSTAVVTTTTYSQRTEAVVLVRTAHTPTVTLDETAQCLHR